MARLVFGRDPEVAKWVVQRVKDINTVEDLGPFQAIGVAIGKKIVAGFVYHNFTEDEIMLSLASEDPRWAQKGVIRAILTYPFVQLNVHRVSLICAKGNKRARKLAEGLGFQVEGKLREHFNRSQDGIIYGMLKPECKWIEHGQEKHPEASSSAGSGSDSKRPDSGEQGGYLRISGRKQL